VADNALDPTADLRYLEAQSVRCPAGTLSDYRVCTQDAQSLGCVKGVLIRPSERRLAYFVIESPGLFIHRRYLLPVDSAAVVQEEPGTLRVSARKDELDLQAFTPRSVPEFSDDDLLKTIFPS
jgi:PRC-barrel domain